MNERLIKLRMRIITKWAIIKEAFTRHFLALLYRMTDSLEKGREMRGEGVIRTNYPFDSSEERNGWHVR